jgi:hypothetical protein
MTDRLAATALRLLAPRARALGPGDHDALENVITNELPNGALCWVIDTFTLYRLDKASTFVLPVSVDPATVITPIAGPGRWFPLAGELTSESSFYAALNDASAVVPISVLAQWQALPGTATWGTNGLVTKGSGSVQPTAFWTIASPSSGILQYTGPFGVFIVEIDASVANADSATEIIVDVAMTKNGFDLGVVDDIMGVQRVVTNGLARHVHVALRTQLASGDTVQPMFRNVFNTEDIAVVFAQLRATPG